jgi:hypothetical protein
MASWPMSFGRVSRLMVGPSYSSLPSPGDMVPMVSNLVRYRLLPGLVFLGWWPLLFSQEWWGHILYEVYGSPAVCCWRELVIS